MPNAPIFFVSRDLDRQSSNRLLKRKRANIELSHQLRERLKLSLGALIGFILLIVAGPWSAKSSWIMGTILAAWSTPEWTKRPSTP
jgi:uncharacterized membrane protein